MQEINNLKTMYDEFAEKNYMTQANLNLLQKQRVGAYRSLKKYNNVPSSIIMDECNGYIAYLTKLLMEGNITQTDFPYTLVIASTMHNPAMKYLSEEEKLALVKSEIDMLYKTVRKYKLTPMKYGRKIKDVKHAMGELQDFYKELENPVK